MDERLVPAAQYLRMSSDHQQYSLENQADAIARYAAQHGFQIVKTCTDPAKSGLRLKNRAGLKQLLNDVMEGQQEFRVVLVYDVSRWGRFQDSDEAAHYEYLCKSAGVPIHYCAEMFANDNSISDLMMKALKRTMAGEFSRELSVKVKAGLVRLTKMGYKAGGYPPYGMRRMLLDVHGTPKQLLDFGQRKSVATERVILVPGPAEEIAVVERLFREYADDRRSMTEIANRLNDEKIPFVLGGKWTCNTVQHALERAQYVGTNVWGRTTAYLSSPSKKVPQECWAVCPKAFQSIISAELFERVQRRLASVTYRLSNEEMLELLKRVLAAKGRLSGRIIDASALCPGTTTYVKRFGGLLNVYRLLGCDSSEIMSMATKRLQGMFVRRKLMKDLVDHFGGQIEELRPTMRFRAMLKVRKTGLLVSVAVARFKPTKTGAARWLMEVPKSERKRTGLLGLMNPQNSSLISMQVFRTMGYRNPTTLQFGLNNRWFQTGVPLQNLSDFLEVVSQVRHAMT